MDYLFQCVASKFPPEGVPGVREGALVMNFVGGGLFMVGQNPGRGGHQAEGRLLQPWVLMPAKF